MIARSLGEPDFPQLDGPHGTMCAHEVEAEKVMQLCNEILDHLTRGGYDVKDGLTAMVLILYRAMKIPSPEGVRLSDADVATWCGSQVVSIGKQFERWDAIQRAQEKD